MKIFGHEFEHLDDEAINDLMSLEREKVIYSDQWVDGLDDFRHVRIRLNDAEIGEYVRSMKAFDLFLGCNSAWARDVPGVPPDIAARADNSQRAETVGYREAQPHGSLMPRPYRRPRLPIGRLRPVVKTIVRPS